MVSSNGQRVSLDGFFRILLIEDDPRGVAFVKGMLPSPVWSIRTASTYAEAALIAKRPVPEWDCIVADIRLEDPAGKTGIDALALFPHFPLKISLSGWSSLEAGAQASRLGGAREVFDKGSPETIRRFPGTVAGFAAMGRMLTGACPEHSEVLFALIESPPDSVQAWAERCCMVRRRLEQLCGQLLGCTPLEAIILHRALVKAQLPDYAGDGGAGLTGAEWSAIRERFALP
jgi:hypothetical protein